MKVNNPLIGADIELFLMHKEDNEIVSAEGLIEGTKNQPYNFDPTSPFFSTSLDNVLAEFNIPPVTNKKEFYDYIQHAVRYINNHIPETLCTVALPSAILNDKYLQTDNAKMFGCEPDMCVWTRGMNARPQAENQNLRSAGGHIHIGYDDPSVPTSELIVKAMDLFIGVPSVIQEPENERKRLYGKAGCCRFKDYGVEYRTISNYYAQDKRLTDWVFESIERALKAVNDGFEFDEYKDRIIDSINNNNHTAANTLIKELDLQLA